MCDLYRVSAQSRDEPFLAQDMADLPELSREVPLEAGGVINELSKIIDELRLEVQKLKEEAGLMAVATAKARISKVTQQLEACVHLSQWVTIESASSFPSILY
ncbi:hypothetical protein GW17_00057859 [Ensete ventricosum]|nr:hypothetical protein GW17_00057859 [Ensete ventricosum]